MEQQQEEQQLGKLEEKAHFPCITVSVLRVYDGVTPTPLSLFFSFSLFNFPFLVRSYCWCSLSRGLT